MNFSAGFDLKNGFSLPGASKQGTAQFELRMGPFVGDQLTVVAFHGREALNEPFVYEVVFSTKLSEDDLHFGTWGLHACLSIHSPRPHEARVVQGLVIDVEATDTPTEELALRRHRYIVKIAPRLWLLRNSDPTRRIFRNQSAVEIACSVLNANGIQPHLQLYRGDYPELPFEYQDDETDWDFLRRVLATAGIFFYFRHASGLLDALVPGGDELAESVGAVANVAASLGGAAACVAGFISETASAVGCLTKIVLTDRTIGTERLNDTGVDLAGAAVAAATGAAAGAVASAFGAVGGIVAGVANIATGGNDVLTYDANGQAGYTDKERIYSFGLRHSLRPKQIRLRHWNVKDATSYEATAKVALVQVDATVSAIATASFSGSGKFGMSAALNVDVDSPSIYTKDATVFEYDRDPSLQNSPPEQRYRMAARALTQARADGLMGRGTSDCRRLAPGYRFTMQRHPLDPLNAEYLVTEMTCEGSSPEYRQGAATRDYSCSFVCVPARVDPLPRKPAPKRHFPTAAIVVGPNPGDIYCDRTHRILVRLRWAESPGDGSFAENGPGICRVHWLERWGGDGYGTQTIPRVGTEVMVEFLEGGDPIAVGQTRTAKNRPTFGSPQGVTKVGIKSRVIPNGLESEISIDDDPDRNKILIHSSGELVTEVRKDTTATHGANYDVQIAGDRREVTSGSATLMYDKDVTLDVLGDSRDQVAKNRIAITDGAVTEWVGGDVSKSVLGRVESKVQGDHNALFEANSLERHEGHHAVVVAATTGTGKASAVLHVEGAASVYAKEEIEAVSPEGFTFSCGDSHITIRKDSVTISSPTINLVGKTVQVTASDTAAFAAKTATIAGSDSVTVSGANKATVAGQSATVILDSNATVQGSAVKLGSGSASPGPQGAVQKGDTKTTVKLTDSDGNPLANERAILRKGGEGGTELAVVLDSKGGLEVPGNTPIEILFEDIWLQDDGKAAGNWRPHIVRPGEFLALLASRYGFDADDVWNDDKNKSLLKAGRNPNILQPGDVVYLPETPSQVSRPPARPGKYLYRPSAADIH